MTDFTSTPTSLKGHVLAYKGSPLHYWVGGPAGRPLLIFTHGATMDHRMFNAQVEAFVEDYRVLVWDVRGHGRSQPMGERFTLQTCVEDLLAILEEVGHKGELVFIGQSMGSYIGQTLYMEEREGLGERLRGMVFIGATPLTKAYSRRDIWALKATMPLFDVWPYGHLTRTIAGATAHTAAVKAYALEACRQIPRADFLRIWKAITLAVDTKGHPAFRFELPLLLMHGEFDGTGTIRKDMEPWAAREPQARFELVPEAGHNANQDNVEYSNRIIGEFVAEVIGERS